MVKVKRPIKSNRIKHIEPVNGKGSRLRDFILGGQDGIVNVLGVILGVATATASKEMALIAALSATFAESISMAAVAYTSFKAEREFYDSEVQREKREMKEVPDAEKKEVKDIYKRLGFGNGLLNRIVDHITSSKRRWLEVMMEQELKLSAPKSSPLNIAFVVGMASLVGSFIPTLPFFFMPVKPAMWTALIISTLTLFFAGVYKGKTTIGHPIRSGIEMAVIGMLAALAGYAIGAMLGVAIIG